MKKLKTRRKILLLVLVFIALISFSSQALAQGQQDDPGGNTDPPSSQPCVEDGINTEGCAGETNTDVDVGQDISEQETYKSTNGECNGDDIKLGVPLENGNDCLKAGKGKNNPIYVYLRTIIRFLSAGIGAVVMLMIVISGVQYITSAGNPDAVQGAKKRLTNAILALVLFIFMSAILNWLIPGGLL